MTRFSELHDASSKPWIQLSSFTALVFLLLTQNCSGLSQVVGPSQPVLATVGGDVVLSCRLEPAVDATDMSIEWSREDLDPSYVYVWWDKEELESSKHPAYKGRTSLLFSKLEFGDVSLKISKVKPSDKGKYRCFIPTLGRGCTVELVVGTDPFTVISLAGLGTSSSVVLQCESAGWYPEPKMLWLDVDGNLLSAGPTKTVRSPDELYTVSSRVTVEKKRGNKFTCRVQQNNINQTREALIQVADDFYEVQSSYTSTIHKLNIIAMVACFLLIFFFVNTLVLKMKKKTLEKTVEQFKEIKRKFMDEKLKSMKTEGKQKTVIQNMNKELDEIIFDTNSEPTGSDEKNQLKELEKLQDENKKLMKTVGNLKNKLQNMDQELELRGPIALEEVSEQGRFIRLKNISTEEIKLGGWKLELQRNNRKSVTYTFDESLTLNTGGILCIRRPHCFIKYTDNIKLDWPDMMKWRPEDKLQIKLISNNGEIFKFLDW